MEDSKVRKQIRCCKCRQVFSLLIDTAGEPEISLLCLYCGEAIHIDLGRYPKKEVQIMRNASGQSAIGISSYTLPDIIETSASDEA